MWLGEAVLLELLSCELLEVPRNSHFSNRTRAIPRYLECFQGNTTLPCIHIDTSEAVWGLERQYYWSYSLASCPNSSILPQNSIAREYFQGTWSQSKGTGVTPDTLLVHWSAWLEDIVIGLAIVEIFHFLLHTLNPCISTRILVMANRYWISIKEGLITTNWDLLEPTIPSDLPNSFWLWRYSRISEGNPSSTPQTALNSVNFGCFHTRATIGFGFDFNLLEPTTNS